VSNEDQTPEPRLASYHIAFVSNESVTSFEQLEDMRRTMADQHAKQPQSETIEIYTCWKSYLIPQVQQAAELIRAVGIWRLAHLDGCWCGAFTIKGIHVEIDCHKTKDGPMVRVWSGSCEYYDKDDPTGAKVLAPVMQAVIDDMNGEDEGEDGAGNHYKQVFGPKPLDISDVYKRFTGTREDALRELAEMVRKRNEENPDLPPWEMPT
jgi:hypothetical protein